MNTIINFVMKNKFAVWLMTIIVTVVGLYSGFNMKLETIPNISIPVLSITTVYPGATPEEVADKVTEPIEQVVQSLNGVKNTSSNSYQNASFIQIEYDYDKNLDKAETEIEKALKGVTLPEKIEQPNISAINFNAFPVVAISAASDSESLDGLTKQVENQVLPALKGIDGVSSVQVTGQQVQEVSLKFDDQKMAKLGLDKDTVINLIKGSNVNFPLGLFTFKDEEQSVVVDGKFTTIEALKEMKIPVVPTTSNNAGNQAGMTQQSQGTGQGSVQTNQAMSGIPTIPLSDIATIKVEGKAESISRTNGKEAIGIQIVKGQEANTVDVVNQVKDKTKELEKKIDGLDIVYTLDQGKPIEDSVKTMLDKAIFGALFAVVIILLFLRNISSTIISIISIPLSLLIAVILLHAMDYSLNIMTLGAMTVAIGRVIDDSIVVIENIYRRMALKSEKLTGRDLIREGTKEMFIPILASTLVTIAVFLPLGLVSGMVGEMFLPFALTIVFSLLASLLVAITIVPMLAHTLLGKGLNKKHHREDHKPGKMVTVYRKTLKWCLNHKAITSLISIALLVGSFFLVPLIGVSFLPSDEEKMMMITYKSAPGETIEEVESSVTTAEKYLQEIKDVKTVQLSVGGENPMSPGSSKDGILFVLFDDDTENFATVKEDVIADLKKDKTKGEWKSQDLTSMSSNEITYYVYGNNMDEVQPYVKEIESIMKKNKDLKNVDTSISDSYVEYTLEANQEKLAQLGLTAGQIGLALNTNSNQEAVTTVTIDGKDLNVYVESNTKAPTSIKDITDKKVTSPLGIEVPISEVVKLKEGKTSDTVTRRNGNIYASVSGELKTDNVSEVAANVQKDVDKIKLPSNIEIDTGGITEDINESFTQLGLAMLAAIAIVYLILVITFGGALAPFAILFSLPFAIIGALVALYISGETISVSAMMGALMLIGIVVTNAIVLIERVLHKEAEGMTTRNALIEAGGTRLRPILMTAIATVGALIPLAMGIEGSGVISRGLGVTVIGGLISSTLLTLIIVPVVYEFLSKFTKKNRLARKNAKNATTVES
ncbi:MAG: efflux RND transporter permease subunit [Bacillaceae bacterium]